MDREHFQTPRTVSDPVLMSRTLSRARHRAGSQPCSIADYSELQGLRLSSSSGNITLAVLAFLKSVSLSQAPLYLLWEEVGKFLVETGKLGVSCDQRYLVPNSEGEKRPLVPK